MRRPPVWVWVSLPLALGLLYAAAHALLSPSPSVSNVVPGEAVLTARFRGLPAVDRYWCFERPMEGRPSELLGGNHNVPALQGVDPGGPLHFVLLPRGARADNALTIFPLQDARAFERAFLGRDEEESGRPRLQRRPHHYAIRGQFAAVAWDRGSVRRLGEGGVTCEERGEDFALAVDVPAAATLALLSARTPPWNGIVRALGAEPDRAQMVRDPRTGVASGEIPAGRLPLVASTWSRASLWAYGARRALEVELLPAPGTPLVEQLREAAAGPALASRPPPREALAWFEVGGHAASRALLMALIGAGVKLPELPDLAAAGGLRGWALANLESGHTWTWLLESSASGLSALAPLLGPVPEPGERRELPANSAPFTISNTRQEVAVAPTTLMRVSVTSTGTQLLALGAEAERHAARAVLAADLGDGALPPPDPEGWRTLARFGLSAQRAPDLLSGALTEGGLLAVLSGGSLEGEVHTNGRVLRVTIRVRAQP